MQGYLSSLSPELVFTYSLFELKQEHIPRNLPPLQHQKQMQMAQRETEMTTSTLIKMC